MNTTASLQKVRGTIIKVPDSSPGLLFASGEQKSFTLAGVWKSPAAPAANMAVDVEIDGSGSIAAITVVDPQQAARERMNQLGGAAQEQGKQAAEMARLGVNVLAARMGKLQLGAAVAIVIAWFFLPAVSVSAFIIQKSFTFWQLLAIDLNNPVQAAATSGSHGLFSILGLAAIAAPFAAPFVRHPRANYLYAAPLAFLTIMGIRIWWAINSAVSEATKVAGGGEMGQFAAKMAEEAVNSMMEAISIGFGVYVLLAAGAFLAFHAYKSRLGPTAA